MSETAADTFLSPNVNTRRTTQAKPHNAVDRTPNPFFPDASSSVEREERDPSESVGRPINIFSDRFDPKSPQSNVVSPLQAVCDSPAGTLNGASESKETDRGAIRSPDDELERSEDTSEDSSSDETSSPTPIFAVDSEMGIVHRGTLKMNAAKKLQWNTFRNTFEAVKMFERGVKRVRARRTPAEGLPSPDRRRYSMSAAAAMKSHAPGWQLRMLAASGGGAIGARDSGVDTDATLSELSNALRAAVAQHLSDPSWMPKLHAFRVKMEQLDRNNVQLADFRVLLKVMFDVRLGEKALKRIFDSLDSARRGVVEWRTVLEYMTPLAHGDLVVCRCANVVTCMVVSTDCSVVAFAGTGFVRAINVGTKVDIFTRKLVVLPTAVALSSDATCLFVGTSSAGSGLVDSFAISKVTPAPQANDAASPQPSLQSYTYPSDVQCISMSIDDMVLAVGGGAKCVQLFHVGDGSLLVSIPYPDIVRSVCISRPLEFGIELRHSLGGSNELSLVDARTVLVAAQVDATWTCRRLNSENALSNPTSKTKTLSRHSPLVSRPPQVKKDLVFATLGPSAHLLSSILSDALGAIPLEHDIRRRTNDTADASLFSDGRAPVVAALFVAVVCTPSERALRLGNGEGPVVTVEDEEGRRLDITLGQDGDGIAIQDWNHWLEKPGNLPVGVATDVTGESNNSASEERGMHLCVGTKVVVAIAGSMVRMKRRTILAMGGDYGSLLVAIFAQRFYAQGEDPNVSPDEQIDCSSKTSPRKLQKRATPSMPSFFSGPVGDPPKNKGMNEAESPSSISLEPMADVSRRLDFLSRKVADEEIAQDLELSMLLGLRPGELTPNVAEASRSIDVFLKRFDKMFSTQSILTEVVEIEMAGTVNGVSISSDGRVVAAGGQGNQVIIVETNYSSDSSEKRCEVVQRYKLGDKVFGVSLSEDGSKVAIGGEDKKVMVLDVKTGCELFQVLADDRVRTVALSRKAHVIGFGGFDQTIKLCNTQRGVNMRAFPVTDVVRGVSLSQDGRLLAICGDNKRLEVFQTDSQECVQSWEHASKIWVVALSGDGRYVAAGDYSEKVILRDVDSGSIVFEHRFVKAGPPAFVWAIALSENGSTLSAGSWNQEICVWRNATLAESAAGAQSGDTVRSPVAPVAAPVAALTAFATTSGSTSNVSDGSATNGASNASAWTLFSTTKKVDRVFSIALADNGNLLGCGDRSGIATVHRLMGPNVEPELLLEAKFPDRVFAVALSSDGNLFAVAGVHKEVWLYSIVTGHRIHVFHIAAAVGEGQSVAFSELPDGGHSHKMYALGVGGEDKCVTIFECFGEFKRVLKLTRTRDINSLAFSQDMVAVASGSRVVITGGCGGHQYSWRDRPDFEHMADLLDGDPVALSVVLERFPSSINLCHPHSGESLMQRAVRLHTNDVLFKVLSVNGSKVGFVQDRARRTALLMALLLEKRDATSMLIEMVASGRVSTMPSSLGTVTECFSLMCKVFPNLLLGLICQTELEREPEMIAQDGAASGSQATFARLTDGESMVRGSSKQAGPTWLWTDVCDDSESISICPIETGIFAGSEAAPTTSSESVYRKYATCAVDDSRFISMSEAKPTSQVFSIARVFSKDKLGSFDFTRSPRLQRRTSESLESTIAAAFRGSMSATPKMEGQSPSSSDETSIFEKQDSENDFRANSTAFEPKTKQVVAIFDPESKSWKGVRKRATKVVRLYAFLGSPPWVATVLLLVALQLTIEFLVIDGRIDVAWRTISYVTSVVFFTEVCLRLWCCRVLKRSALSFFKSPLNAVDFAVVMIDVVAFAFFLFASLSASGGASSSSASLRAIRLAKVLQSSKALKTFRLARAFRLVAASRTDSSAASNQKRAEVVALRVPFENFAGYYSDPDESPLHLITIAAQRLHRLDVFESPVMRATIDFKWNTFARRLFYGQFVIFLCFLSAVVVFSIFASRTCGNEDFPAMEDVWAHPQGKMAVLISPFVLLFSFLSLTNELQQLLITGSEAYFASIWNYLDISSFGLEVIATGAWFARGDEGAVRGLLATAIMLLFMKTMYFARGFPLWGPLVRMLVNIVDDMRPFVLILFIFVIGFTVTFFVYNSREPQYAGDEEVTSKLMDAQILDVFQLVVRLAVFSDREGYTMEGDPPASIPGGTLNSIYFSGMMTTINIILLNLLIAIMATSYSRVQKFSQLEAMYERATIIMEMEQSMLPLVTAFKRWYFFAHYRYQQLKRKVMGRGVRAAGNGGSVSASSQGDRLPLEDEDAETAASAWKAQLALDRAANFPAWLHILRGGTADSSPKDNVDYDSESDTESGGSFSGGNSKQNGMGANVSSKQLDKISKKLNKLITLMKDNLEVVE